MALASTLLATPKQDPAVRSDDAAVYEAVIEHTLRESFQSYAGASRGGARAVIQLAGWTIPRCGATRVLDLGCVDVSEIDTALSPNTSVERIPPDRLPTLTARAELTADFKSRNAESRALPTVHGADVTVLSAEAFREVQNRLINGQRGVSAAFSLPAYSTDAHAVVYVMYVCGNVCGRRWIFLLERVDDVWRVQGRQLLGIA